MCRGCLNPGRRGRSSSGGGGADARVGSAAAAGRTGSRAGRASVRGRWASAATGAAAWRDDEVGVMSKHTVSLVSHES